MAKSPFAAECAPNWQALHDCIVNRSTPERVHHIELFLDGEIQQEIARRYGLWEGIDASDPYADCRRQVAMQRFIGFDYVRQGLDALDMPMRRHTTDDTAGLERGTGRSFVDEHAGPITSWAEFEAYPWPDPDESTTRRLEWYEENLPDDMCVIGSGGFAHFAEHITWLMGYETLCYALYDQRDLVQAISERLVGIFKKSLARMLEFERVRIIWGSDDMGFKTGTLISPDDLREFVLPGHRLMAEMSHDAGRPYLLHACGNLSEIMEDLIEQVGIDARHSFEDTIEPVTDAYDRYGERIAILGGIDVDFLCRADEQQIRERVRRTLEHCMPGGGYCLGSGNSVANYIPVDNYLAMVDEGRRFTARG